LHAPDASKHHKIERTIAQPDDNHALRARDPAAAAKERARVRDELTAAFADGLEVVDFDRASGYRCSARNRSAAS
jgi:hypothetical protein